MFTRVRFLDESDAQRLKQVTSDADVGHGDADVTLGFKNKQTNKHTNPSPKCRIQLKRGERAAAVLTKADRVAVSIVVRQTCVRL